MNKKELLLQTLEKMGYKPKIDNDDDIMIRYQIKTLYVLAGDDEEPYVVVILPQFYEIAEGEEMLTMTVCNKMTRELKMVKVYIDQTLNNVSASCEFFYANEEALEDGLNHSLEMLGIVRSVFKKNKSDLSED